MIHEKHELSPAEVMTAFFLNFKDLTLASLLYLAFTRSLFLFTTMLSCVEFFMLYFIKYTTHLEVN